MSNTSRVITASEATVFRPCAVEPESTRVMSVSGKYNDVGAKGANRNLIKTIEKQQAARAERLKDLLAENKKDGVEVVTRARFASSLSFVDKQQSF